MLQLFLNCSFRCCFYCICCRFVVLEFSEPKIPMGANSGTIFKKSFLSKSWSSFHLKYLVWEVLNQNCFLRLALNRTICRKMWKISFFRAFNRNINFSFFFYLFFISVLNQLRNHQFMTCYSSLRFILLKMSINILLKWKLNIRTTTLD